jgi:hypothetical protein
MPNYSQAKIYVLRDKHHNIFYVSSTTKSLEHRYKQHVNEATDPEKPDNYPEDFTYPVYHHIRKLKFKFYIHEYIFYPICKNRDDLLELESSVIKELLNDGIKLMNLQFTKKYHCPCGGKYHKLTKELHLKSTQHNNYLKNLPGYSTAVSIKKSSLQAMINAPVPSYKF